MKKFWIPALLSLVAAGVIQFAPQVMAKNEQAIPSKTEKSERKDTKEVKEIKNYQLEKPIKATGSAKPVTSPKPKEKAATESAGVRTKQGAQFFIQDPASGVVTLVTPSGNTHTLNLPQSAIANMTRNGLLQTGTATVSATKADKVASKSAMKKGPSAFETTDENGDLVVKQAVIQKKKLFGIIPVNLTLEATINEKTGKTTINPNSLIGRILSLLSVE